MIGLEYTHDMMGPLMSFFLQTNGVFAIFSGNNPKVMRLMPAPVIDERRADQLIDALDRSMNAALKSSDVVMFFSKLPVFDKIISVQELQVVIILIAKTLKKLTPFKK